jgi:transposase-like protein
VDLRGRLSNPGEAIEKLSDQGWSGPARHRGGNAEASGGPNFGHAAASPKQRGRLSNPVQRRLPDAEILEVISRYREGASIDGLARRFEVHRTTIIANLDRAGVARRRLVRKMTDESVARAARRYDADASLAVVALEFGVHARTLAREFRRAGVSIRPRRGW